MKNIVKKIYEGNSGFQRASEIRTQMFFAETAQALLFIAEMSGQISDGKYENSKPYNHWLWVAGKMEIFTKTTGDLGYISNYKHAKKYTKHSRAFGISCSHQSPEVDTKDFTNTPSHGR